MPDNVQQRNITFVHKNHEPVPARMTCLGYLTWHQDNPDWIEWQLSDITKADKAAGFISVPCWINAQVRK